MNGTSCSGCPSSSTRSMATNARRGSFSIGSGSSSVSPSSAIASARCCAALPVPTNGMLVQTPSISASSASSDGSSTSAASAATSSGTASPRSSVMNTRPSRRRAITRSPRHAGSNIHSMLWTTASDGVASWGRSF